MPSNSTIVDVTYDDPRTGQRVRERRVQEIPYEELDQVRDRELALVRAPRDQEVSRYRGSQQGDGNDNDNDVDRVQQRRVREPRDDDGYLPPQRSNDDRDRNRNLAPHRRDEDYGRRNSRRRATSAYDDDDSDSESSRERRHRRHRRAKSEKAAPQKNDDGGGKMFYSMKDRRDGHFGERNFDSSYDGLIAGAAGAAIGAITARRFGGTEKRGLKIIGGAVAGAAVINSAENWFRVFTEEKEERKEEKEERQQKARSAAGSR
ncbi:hypothetical protein LTR36_010098 [Oleoguttula mirabilis]|uniref:Glycine zipper 2TM domain-containing protein n=1 Tax=Oleoguttula mirabilis TaxID=1507867 RepID=A0AAV9JRY0_9PEZI|nr:hypothetical protein LTR36_010098 [Oleoguttula mirabilis]